MRELSPPSRRSGIDASRCKKQHNFRLHFERTRYSIQPNECYIYSMKDDQPQNMDQADIEEPAPAEKKPVPNWKKRVRKIIWPLHARYPNTIPNPYGSDKEYIKERDTKDNIESALEESVKLQLGCIMVSEIFGPADIDALYQNLERIGWDRERSPIPDSESNVASLRKMRLYGSEGTLRPGWVCRLEDVRKYGGVRYTAEFPSAFSSLLVTITQLTPSVTCLTIGFILSDESAAEYANEINKPAKTINVRRRGERGYFVDNVAHIKMKRVQRTREKYQDLCISWISSNFPGHFAKHCKRSHFPTVEFVSVEGFTPFDKEEPKDRSWMHWSRFVNIGYDFSVWTCTSVPSLRFSLDAAHWDKNPNHMTVALRWDTVSEDDKRHYSGDSLSSRVYFANDRLDGVIPRYALATYLRELLRNLKETRQAVSGILKPKDSSGYVDEISTFFRRSVGVPSIAREALALSKNDASFRWNATGFSQQIRPSEDKTYEIAEGLKSSLGLFSQQLLEEDRDTREFLSQLSSAMGTRESITAQRRMEWVAVLALLVAVISMGVAFYSVNGGAKFGHGAE